MKKTILLTGATDGIGLAAAETLVSLGHHVLLHGRSAEKLEALTTSLSTLAGGGSVESYVADFSRMAEVTALVDAVRGKHETLDVLINNAGVYKLPQAITGDGLDARFVVNTLAPYRLTQGLLPLLQASSRIINLSSAAQAPVNLDSLAGRVQIYDDYAAYAQSKLALTMWSRQLGLELKGHGPVVIAVNPGSLLASKMVKEGFGVEGKDIHIGSDILVRLALDDEFSSATALYFDNDAGQLDEPHPDALDAAKAAALRRVIEETLDRLA